MLTLSDTDQESAFRAECRRWAQELPLELCWTEEVDRLLEVDRRMARDGLLGVSWPAQYGGRGLPRSFESILTEELGAVGVRRSIAPSHQGINNLAPTLMSAGTTAQRLRHLPPILSCETIWCQGFSEPDAGSDLANIRTTAYLDGDRIVVNGSKLWTSNAQHADWIYLLVRTGVADSRHRGLSFVLAPMDSPGISVVPIRTITGVEEFCEVHFDDVIASSSDVVGEVGQGWAVAMTLLSFERLSGRYRYGLFRREVGSLARQLARHGTEVGSSLVQDLGRVAAEVEGMGALALLIESHQQSYNEVPPELPSVNKLWWPLAHQRLQDLGLRAATLLRDDSDEWYRGWLNARAESIYGGSAQVQRNIIAERHLGMPRS